MEHRRRMAPPDFVPAKEALNRSGTFHDTARAPWRLTLHGAEVFSMPRAVVLRSLPLNRYRHRSQLSLYLRLLDVLVPVIYGRKCGRESVRVTGELS